MWMCKMPLCVAVTCSFCSLQARLWASLWCSQQEIPAVWNRPGQIYSMKEQALTTVITPLNITPCFCLSCSLALKPSVLFAAFYMCNDCTCVQVYMNVKLKWIFWEIFSAVSKVYPPAFFKTLLLLSTRERNNLSYVKTCSSLNRLQT